MEPGLAIIDLLLDFFSPRLPWVAMDIPTFGANWFLLFLFLSLAAVPLEMSFYVAPRLLVCYWLARPLDCVADGVGVIPI